MRVKSVLASLVGLLQILIGVSAIIAAYLIYYNPSYFEVRTLLGLRGEYVAFFFLILGVVGFFSIISGVLVIHEWAFAREGQL